MSGFNQLQIIGNIGKFAEIKTLPSGKRVLSFSLAVNEKRGQEEITTWFDCSMFRARAGVQSQLDGADRGSSFQHERLGQQVGAVRQQAG